jgi:hypothetical protein
MIPLHPAITGNGRKNGEIKGTSKPPVSLTKHIYDILIYINKNLQKGGFQRFPKENISSILAFS